MRLILLDGACRRRMASPASGDDSTWLQARLRRPKFGGALLLPLRQQPAPCWLPRLQIHVTYWGPGALLFSWATGGGCRVCWVCVSVAVRQTKSPNKHRPACPACQPACRTLPDGWLESARPMGPCQHGASRAQIGRCPPALSLRPQARPQPSDPPMR